MSLLDNISPFERLLHKASDYSIFQVFGCECFSTLLTYPHKLDPWSKQCVFVGYAHDYKGYWCLDSPSGCVYVIHHILFHEDSFPYLTLTSHDLQVSNIFDTKLIVTFVSGSSSTSLPEPKLVSSAYA